MYIVFYEEKDSILEPGYGAGGINGVGRPIQPFLQRLIFLKDFGLKPCMAVQECKIKVTGSTPRAKHTKMGRFLFGIRREILAVRREGWRLAKSSVLEYRKV